jgi:hypothetical protein
VLGGKKYSSAAQGSFSFFVRLLEENQSIKVRKISEKFLRAEKM